MFNTAYRMLGNVEEAQDVLQDSFVSAFRNLSSYRGEASFGSWLKRIVINKTINASKKQLEHSSVEDYDFVEEQEEEQYKYSYSIESVKEAMTELPNGFRQVLTLYLFEGYDHKEIGEILGISESTSKSQYNRAKKKLRELLPKEVKYG